MGVKATVASGLAPPLGAVFLPGMFLKGGSWCTAADLTACSPTEEEACVSLESTQPEERCTFCLIAPISFDWMQDAFDFYSFGLFGLSSTH